MKRLVVDAPALADWFTADGPPLRGEYERGMLAVVGPRSLTTDLVAELAARASVDETAIVQLSDEVDRLGFELRNPATRDVARWIARGLDARQAAYAALAEAMDLSLVSDDPELRRIAGARVRGTQEA